MFQTVDVEFGGQRLTVNIRPYTHEEIRRGGKPEDCFVITYVEKNSPDGKKEPMSDDEIKKIEADLRPLIWKNLPSEI